MDDITFWRHDGDVDEVEPGVTAGWLVVYDGPGPGIAQPAAIVKGDDGERFIMQTGPAEAVTITDD